MDRWRADQGPPPTGGGGRRLPRPRGGGGSGAHSDVDRWRPRDRGGGAGYDDYHGRRPGTFDSRSGDYHPQRLMRGMDGLDGPPRFTYGGSWRSRYDDDYPPERTELWSGENRHRLDTGAATPRSRHRLDPALRNDSLSSDPSDCMSAPAIPTAASAAAAAASSSRLTPKHHRALKNGGGAGAGSGGPRARRQSSMSSSDDGVQTTPEGTSCDEQEIESESIVSEMGETFHSAPSSANTYTGA